MGQQPRSNAGMEEGVLKMTEISLEKSVEEIFGKKALKKCILSHRMLNYEYSNNLDISLINDKPDPTVLLDFKVYLPETPAELIGKLKAVEYRIEILKERGYELVCSSLSSIMCDSGYLGCGYYFPIKSQDHLTGLCFIVKRKGW